MPLLNRYILFSIVVLFTLNACGSSSSSSSSNCDTVANPNGPAYFKVENRLNSGLEWFLPAYAFGADMKPDECTIMGVAASQLTVEVTQCNIGGGACTSTFGPTKMIVFNVSSGDTFTLKVTDNTFL
jgi:hypothetical protein